MQHSELVHTVYARLIRALYAALAYAVCACFPAAVHALPGVTPYIPDTSGEYVFYEDKTFNRTSCIGFLYYDDSTYSARYYAPAENGLPEKNIELLFTVDPTADHLEMTGERFITELTAEDSDIVNYLHDILYELTSRRKKQGDVSPQTETISVQNGGFAGCGTESPQDFMQFGGLVTMLYDWRVPLFNLKRITDSGGKLLLQAVTAGCLVSSQDTSFSDFSGIPADCADSSHPTAIKNTERTEAAYTVERSEGTVTQTLTLDSAWTQPFDQMWLLGDNAYVALSTMELTDGARRDMLVRRLLLSTEHSYNVWRDVQLTVRNGLIQVYSRYYQTEGIHSADKTVRITRDYKTITNAGLKGAPDLCGWFSLTVFDSIYNNNTSYFDTILKSYRCVSSKQ